MIAMEIRDEAHLREIADQISHRDPDNRDDPSSSSLDYLTYSSSDSDSHMEDSSSASVAYDLPEWDDGFPDYVFFFPALMNFFPGDDYFPRLTYFELNDEELLAKRKEILIQLCKRDPSCYTLIIAQYNFALLTTLHAFLKKILKREDWSFKEGIVVYKNVKKAFDILVCPVEDVTAICTYAEKCMKESIKKKGKKGKKISAEEKFNILRDMVDSWVKKTEGKIVDLAVAEASRLGKF
ncbi:hypothetical protein IFM89_025816 [Coptis chinensis]|uniref:Uncharacterized protein n=1 Tax=Coptis chinensis TaxID=261450 RepID=A0A835H8X6_9MAGN|nr:hypothetical protein IFM89_025816 [Coptis chinensis]